MNPQEEEEERIYLQGLKAGAEQERRRIVRLFAERYEVDGLVVGFREGDAFKAMSPEEFKEYLEDQGEAGR